MSLPRSRAAVAETVFFVQHQERVDSRVARCGNLAELFEGVVSTSRADTASMQSPCRAKRLYKCTASAGEESKDTELFGEEKQQRVTNLFQSVKTYKSQ